MPGCRRYIYQSIHMPYTQASREELSTQMNKCPMPTSGHRDIIDHSKADKLAREKTIIEAQSLYSEFGPMNKLNISIEAESLYSDFDVVNKLKI